MKRIWPKWVPVKQLRIGDVVDLQRDPIADPFRNPSFRFDLQTVRDITYQDNGIFIEFSGNATILFPYDASVKQR